MYPIARNETEIQLLGWYGSKEERNPVRQQRSV